jgi:hypothetical protein
MENMYNAETGCCPRFDPAGWDGKEHIWKDKPFITDKIPAIFHIPLKMGKVVMRCCQKITDAKAATATPPLFLCDETSPWKTILHIETAKDIPTATMTRISGTFVSKVFEGPYKDAPKWYQQMGEFVKSSGKQAKKIYAYYTACPKCAKHYGKNYVVLLAKID